MRRDPPFLKNFIIRAAGEEDVPAILDVLSRIESGRSSVNGFLNFPITGSYLSRHLSAITVAVKDSSVAGFAILDKPLVPDKQYSNIHVKQLGVSPEFQRSKCATALYFHISHGCKNMTAKVNVLPEPNAVSLKFHSNLGFARNGIATCNGRESLILSAKSTAVRKAMVSPEPPIELVGRSRPTSTPGKTAICLT